MSKLNVSQLQASTWRATQFPSAAKFRHELKYYVSHQHYHLLRQRLSFLLQRDEHAGTAGEYHIRSLYFDDINNKALHEKLSGVANRTKYRIRIYNHSDKIIHFEKKIKQQDAISKIKEPISKELYASIMANNYQPLFEQNKPLLTEIYYEAKQRLLRPKVIVDYIREAFINYYGNVRITFDKQLRTGLNNLDLFDQSAPVFPVLDDGNIIMEIKYDEYLPEAIRCLLQMEGLVRQSASKYVICRKWLKQNSWEDQ